MTLSKSVIRPRENECAVAVFGRSPRPGFSKTRLIPLLGPQGAAEIQEALLADALGKFKRLHEHAELYLMTTGRFPVGQPYSREQIRILPQRGKDLGERLGRAFGFLLRRHWRAIITGTDSPELPAQTLLQAFEELRWCDAVLGPCPDGGYYLIGLRRAAGGNKEDLLAGIRWGTRWALRDTLRNLISEGLSCSLLPPLADIDRPADIRALYRRIKQDSAMRRMAPATWRFISRSCISAANR
ncbi:MAG: TIGR04282 family arsenosugar biosynthesis glycosyltransferase [Terriglobia bacterium]